MRSLHTALVALVVACQQSSPPPPKPAPPTAPADAAVANVDAGPVFRSDKSTNHVDPTVVGSGKTFMVVSESEPATKAGRDILAAGGNAVDAAVATAFALAVTHPTAGNIGGGGFAVVHVAPGKDVALDFREVAPAAATADMYLDAQGKPTLDSLIGHRASGVPGSVAGLYELHKKLGKKPWKELVAPAIALARDGFEVDRFLNDAIGRPRNRARLEKFPVTAATWIPNHRPREVGDIVKQPDLATTLERIADKGPDGFYTGPTADAIVAEMKRGNGLITAADLRAYKPVWRDPMKVGYRGYTLVTMPLPSSGGIAIVITANMLRAIESPGSAGARSDAQRRGGSIELGKLGWHTAAHVHWLAEIWRRSFAARNELLGDPAFVKPPVDRLVSQAYADKLVASITDKATPSAAIAPLLEGNHTTNLSVVDGTGMAVALTTTLNTSWGSCVTVTGAGFLLNNEMDDFAAKPGSPNIFGLVQGAANKIEPGKRMLSSMTPTIAVDAKGATYMVAGAGGGPRIITAVWQTISNVVDFRMPVDAAIAAPRVHHQHLPDVLKIEADAIDRATDESLRAMGYKLDWGDGPAEFAEVTAIVKSDRGWDGASDPRRGGKAMGD